MPHWTIHQKREPENVHRSAVVVDKDLYCFGGDGDVHIFNTGSLSWRKVTPGRGDGDVEVPSMRYGHTAVLIEGTVYIWGGCWEEGLWGGDNNELYAFDVDAHMGFKPSRVSGAVPEARMGHSACVLGKVMFIHGGKTKLSGRTNDMYKLDTGTMVWTLVETRSSPPPVSYLHSATILGTKMFVFGGDVLQYNSLRVFDTETDLWLSTPAPLILPYGRCDHSAFTYNGELYISGGYHKNLVDDFNDLWKFSPETFSWKNVEPKGKGPGNFDDMFCCMVGDCIIFCGHKGWRTPTDHDLFILDFSPTLKPLCKLSFIQYHLDQTELPHNIRWELVAMTTNNNRKITLVGK